MNPLLLAATLTLAAVAAVRPAFRAPPTTSTLAAVDAWTWPAELEGAPLVPATLLPVEAKFAAGFPGATTAFFDDGRRVVMRRITQATRKLHPAETCLRAAGYAVRARPALRHPASGLWGVVRAEKEGRALVVREHIVSTDGLHTWTDVSAWYWSAVLHPERGPWLAVTVIEADASG